MTVQNPIVKNVYTGNGATTVFPYTFALNQDDGEYVTVVIADEAGAETAVTNFKVDTLSRTVTYPYPAGEPLPEGSRIAIRRAVPMTQELNLENQGPFFAEDIETALDRIVMQVQQINEQIDRSIKVNETGEQAPADLLNHIYERAGAAEQAAEQAAASAAETAGSVDIIQAATEEAEKFAQDAEYSKNQTIGYAALIMGRAAETWKPDKHYSDSDVVVYSDGYIYQCKGDSAPGTLPPDSDLWIRIKVALDDYFIMDGNCYLTLSENPTFSNTFTFNQAGYVTLKEA